MRLSIYIVALFISSCASKVANQSLFSITWMSSCTDSVGTKASKPILVEYYDDTVLTGQTSFENLGKSSIERTTYYDHSGHEVKKEVRIDSRIESITTFLRDSFGNIVKVFAYGDGQDTSIFVCTNQYNPDSSQIESKVYFRKQLLSITKYTYAQKKLMQVETYSMNDDSMFLESKESYIYDRGGNKIEEWIQNPDGSTKAKTVYKYKGNKLVAKEFYKKDILSYQITFFYKDGKKDHATRYDYKTKSKCQITFVYQYL